jgi:hypothetical protein
MYKCYKNTTRPSIPFCCDKTPQVSADPKGYPESMRLSGCEQAIVTVNNSQSCLYTVTIKPTDNLPPNKILVPVTSQQPIVDVGTTSASQTIAQKKNAVIFRESDPYNPATRFNKYFPAPPIPYQCPERIPNNDPKPSTAPCLPIQRFQGSTKN